MQSSLMCCLPKLFLLIGQFLCFVRYVAVSAAVFVVGVFAFQFLSVSYCQDILSLQSLFVCNNHFMTCNFFVLGQGHEFHETINFGGQEVKVQDHTRLKVDFEDLAGAL